MLEVGTSPFKGGRGEGGGGELAKDGGGGSEGSEVESAIYGAGEVGLDKGVGCNHTA